MVDYAEFSEMLKSLLPGSTRKTNMVDYAELSEMFKALSDPNRLMIVEMLSGGELCACKLLDRYKIPQPTLSHHMKTLCHAGLVKRHREGKWMHYTLDDERFSMLTSAIDRLAGKEK